MKNFVGAGVVAGTILLAAVVPADAATPPDANGHEIITATCDGQQVTVEASGGTAFWIGEHKYAISSITFTFTPADGSAPQTFTKVNGKRSGKDGTVTCTGTETDETGTTDFLVLGDEIR
jgi:hypothetical protein